MISCSRVSSSRSSGCGSRGQSAQILPRWQTLWRLYWHADPQVNSCHELARGRLSGLDEVMCMPAVCAHRCKRALIHMLGHGGCTPLLGCFARAQGEKASGHMRLYSEHLLLKQCRCPHGSGDARQDSRTGRARRNTCTKHPVAHCQAEAHALAATPLPALSLVTPPLLPAQPASCLRVMQLHTASVWGYVAVACPLLRSSDVTLIL